MWEDVSWVYLEEVSWDEVVEVLNGLRRWLLALIEFKLEMVMYGCGRLVELMLQVMNLVWSSESCHADWKRSLLVPLHKDGEMRM